MKKRLGSILLALATVLTLVPAFTTGAAAEKKNADTLYIAGNASDEESYVYDTDGDRQFVSYGAGYTALKNGDTIDPITHGDPYDNAAYAKFTYHETGHSVLELNGYRTWGAVGYEHTLSSGNQYLYGIYYDGNLTIQINGDNELMHYAADPENPEKYHMVAGIFVDGELTIVGSGSLTADFSRGSVSASYRSYGIRSGKTTFEERGGSLAINAYGGASTESGSYGIENFYGLTFTGDGGSLSVDARGGKCSKWISYGIDTSNVLTFEENDTSISVNAVGADSSYRSWGVGGGEGISIGKNARLTAIGGTATYSDLGSCGIYSSKPISINGGVVIATAGEAPASCGIHCNNTFTFSSGSLTARGMTKALEPMDDSSYSSLTAPILLGGSQYDGSDAARAVACDKSWRYTALESREKAIRGAVSGTALNWFVKMPASGASFRVIAAWYDDRGKMLGAAASNRITVSGYAPASRMLAVDSGAARYRLFLLDDTSFAPLGEAWDSSTG